MGDLSGAVLHNPSGRASGFLTECLKIPSDKVEQSLYAYPRIKKPNHVLDAEPSLLACPGKVLNGPW